MAAPAIVLSGDNLGERHRQFNQLVSSAAACHAQRCPEHSALDRLFKIDLAAKLRDVDYIISNLQDDDMLYVSRALRASWLLEPQHSDIINPSHLEEVLFPRMIAPAVSKMKHWLYINLRDPMRCAEFYEHYRKTDLDFAIKLLRHCSVEYALEEFPKMLSKISPRYLKIFSEKSPQFAKIYFDAIATDMVLARQYLSKSRDYFDSIKCLLKGAPDVFLDITEQVYEGRFGRAATAHIVRYCKPRFMHKAELYAARLLHMPTLATSLSAQECEELVMRLARAKYLSHWFSYKNVEPLVKRLSPDRRAGFKRRVFVNKDVGASVEEWPYPTPKAPIIKATVPHVFDDVEMPRGWGGEEFRCSVKCCRADFCQNFQIRQKTELDRLFDEYRYMGFAATFAALSQRLGSAGSVESRRDMLLVLVSKSGARADCVATLLQLLARHGNEAAHARASVVRSLVRRARVWRLPPAAWAALLAFQGDLDFAECCEALHALVLRHLLAGDDCAPATFQAFLAQFNSLAEYPLDPSERALVSSGLTRLLLGAAAQAEPAAAARHLAAALDVNADHHVRLDAGSPVVAAIKELASRDLAAATPLLHRLYEARVARKELFSVNLTLHQNDACYVNVLRHDPTAFVPDTLIKLLVDADNDRRRRRKRFDQFTHKLSLYFGEDLAERLLVAIKAKLVEKPVARLARPLAAVIGREMRSYLETFEATEDIDVKRVAAALRACGHRCRPKLDVDTFELERIGAKALASRALVCRSIDVNTYVNKLLNWRRTVRVAIVVAQKIGQEVKAFETAAKIRPLVAIKAALPYFRRRGDKADPRVWEIVKPIMLALNISHHKQLPRNLDCVQSMPATIRHDYCVTLWTIVNEDPGNTGMVTLNTDLEIALPYISTQSMEKNLLMLLKKEKKIEICLYLNIFVRYLLLCESEEDQNRRYEMVGTAVLEIVERLLKKYEIDLMEYELPDHALDLLLKSLKYRIVCFDTKYVSCLPILERIVVWMHRVLPIEKYFNKYVEIHSTMIYFQAVRESIQSAPQIFQDSGRRMTEGVNVVGVTFGKFAAKELRALICKYFDSVVELYNEAFVHYLNVYFPVGPSKSQFIRAVIKGILEESVGSEVRLGVHVFKQLMNVLDEVMRKEIKAALIEKGDQSKFFLYAVLSDLPNVSGDGRPPFKPRRRVFREEILQKRK